MSKRQAKIRTLSLEEGEAILDRSTPMRSVRASRIKRYAAEMTAKRWSVHGQGISLDEAGRLIDGHHRINAMLMAGIPVEFLIVTGCDQNDMFRVDEGQKRKLTDFLAAQGKKQAQILAAACKVLFDYKNGQLGRPFFQSTPMSIETGLTVARAGGKKLEASILRYRHLKPLIRNVAPGGFQVFMHYKGVQAWGEDDTEKWFHVLNTGEGLAATDPVHRLREHLFRQMRSTPGQRPPLRTRMAIYIKAWNMWVRGDTCKQLHWRSFGKNKEPFPQPVFTEFA